MLWQRCVGQVFIIYARLVLIASCAYNSFSRRDPYLAAQLEATKRDSMRSLKTDEQRRFERLGYDSGGGSRSRTTERKRPSAGSTGSRRSSSKESAPPRRSDSQEHRTGDKARSVVTRASSARQLKVKGEGGLRIVKCNLNDILFRLYNFMFRCGLALLFRLYSGAKIWLTGLDCTQSYSSLWLSGYSTPLLSTPIRLSIS